MPPNRLSKEKSPYLLQHAENPVDWYPWGEEAFQKAQREDRPIFLSIGYSTCHWCHVMERESFENPEIAELLNRHFVPVKVDREERPDVDSQYMTAVQGLIGQGGWPLTALLTPGGQPFFGGTYFPPEDRMGRPGLRRILLQLSRAWTNQREEVLATAEQVTAFVRGRVPQVPGEPGKQLLEFGLEQFRNEFDPVHGGFGPAPKFPRPHTLHFLLRRWFRNRDEDTLRMVEHTLDHMARGGIHDHLGGGFARYSTDRRWLVPHFEKMLYDQALLARAYLETHQATGAARHARVARDVFDYVLRDLRDPGGAFLSAEDADSEGEEGRFYVWTPEEVQEILGQDEYGLFAAAYGVTPDGNFEGGRTVLSRVAEDDALAARFDLDFKTVAERLARSRDWLFRARENRPRPHLDDKILTDWNGLMIGALALGGRVLKEDRYTRAAVEAAEFIRTTLVEEDILLHRFRDGEASIPAFLDDHAFLARGIFELYRTTRDPAHLAWALRLTRDIIRLFEDPEAGGFFFTSDLHPPLLTRDKQLYDGAVPSGNSVAIAVLLALGDLTGDSELTGAGERGLRAFGGAVATYPAAYPEYLCGLDFALGPTTEVVVVGERNHPATRQMLDEVDRPFLPRTVFAFRDPEDPRTGDLIPYAREMTAPPRRAAAYVCTERACEQPVHDPSALRDRLTP